MDFECILYEKDEGIATIKLNRPHVLNAMNKQLWLDFQVALEDVKNDPEIKVLIITGEGKGIFHRGRFKGFKGKEHRGISRLPG